jgi:RNA polymerase sigma-70 factor, ECF subfamily
MDEMLLIQQARRGDVEAFNQLILSHQTSAYNLAYRIVGDSAAAADVTQEAFISAFEHLTQFRGGSFKSWLMRIVANACYDERRRQKRRPASSLEELSEDGDTHLRLVSSSDTPEQVAQQSALSRVIQDCLDGLSDEYRLVAVLSDVQEYSYQEVADITRVSLGTVKSRLSRARQRLRDCLQGAGELLPAMYRFNDQATESSD